MTSLPTSSLLGSAPNSSSRDPRDVHSRLLATLTAIRARARMLLIIGALGTISAGVLLAVMALGAADFVLRTPAWLRGTLWVFGVAAVVVAVRRRILPAVRFAPSLTEVALRIERSDPGRHAGLAGVLASGVELGSGPEALRAAGLVRDAGARFGTVAASSLLMSRATSRAVGLLAIALVVAGAAWAASPVLASIGVRRIVTPWAGAQWPKRTAIADATDQAPHARGSGFLMRAVVSRNPTLFSASDSADDTRVIGRFRLIIDGEPSPTRRVLLTKQNNVEPAPGSFAPADREPDGDAEAPAAASTAGRGGGEGALFEYLIEPWGLAPARAGDAGARAGASAGSAASATDVELEYWFETDDDATEPARVLLVEPPAIVSVSMSLTPPDYYTRAVLTPAGESAGTPAPPAPTRASDPVDLGMGADDRAAPKPILRGSRVNVTVVLNKPVPPPPSPADPAFVEWITRTLGRAAGTRAAASGGPADAASPFSVSLDQRTLRLAWIMADPLRMDIHLRDDHGIENVESYSYLFDALDDRAPQASVTLPMEDKTVLATASLDLLAEGRDDVGLRSIALWQQVARRPAESSGAPAEPVREPAELVHQDAAAATHASDAASEASRQFGVPGSLPVRLEVGMHLSLETLNVTAGDEVWLTARAADGFELNGATHERTVSAVRRLRIISEEQFLEQVWSELLGVRRSAISMAEEQARLEKETARHAEASRLERSQAAISDRIAREQEAIEQIEARLGENGLRDDAIRDILRDARQSLESAGKSSVSAGANLNQAKQNEQQQGSPDEQSRDAARDDQQDTQRSLEDLAERLDQGEDTWSMKRSVEKLLEEQKALKQKTGDIGRETTGRSTKDLTPAERESLEQASQAQQGLAERAAEAIQKMMDAEQKVRKNDPAAADAMSEATRQAQRDQLQEKMEQAAEQVGQNQTNTAQSQQQQAIESMQQMLDQLANTSKNRDEVLRRQLASLIESLQGLIRDQERQLDALMEGIVNRQVKGLDRGMARLHQNTLAVLDEAQSASREIAPVAELIEAAADAQQQAVVALRVEPLNADEAQDQEVQSLEKLKEALALAQKLDSDAQNRQTQRQRAELKKAYADALTQQLTLRQETDALVNAEQNRRTRAEARTLGERQQQLQDVLARLQTDSKELSDAVMFSFAHKRLDDVMGKAASSLGEGTADRGVTRHQDSAIKVLQALVQALDEAQQKEDEFRQQQQEQQQGNGNQQNGQMPLVPPTAQVKLLRLMQEETLDLTREASESGDAGQLTSAAQLQKDLAERADELIKKMMERRRPPAPGVPEPGGENQGDAPPPGPPVQPPAEPPPGVE